MALVALHQLSAAILYSQRLRPPEAAREVRLASVEPVVLVAVALAALLVQAALALLARDSLVVMGLLRLLNMPQVVVAARGRPVIQTVPGLAVTVLHLQSQAHR